MPARLTPFGRVPMGSDGCWRLRNDEWSIVLLAIIRWVLAMQKDLQLPTYYLQLLRTLIGKQTAR